MADKSLSHYFYKLLKLNSKKVRCQHRHEFLRRCQDQDIKPDGLRLYKTANIGRFSEGFEDNWEAVLSGASRAMRDLITREAWIAIESIDRNILELERVVGREFKVQVLEKFVRKITDSCGKLTPSLQQRRSKKLSRLELLDQESALVDNEQSSVLHFYWNSVLRTLFKDHLFHKWMDSIRRSGLM